jgi:4-diphosphocytidyl-2-C-methyl-D-erythritol kinase
VLTARAPAKINLVLEVLGRRADGYHDICGIAQTIDVYDTLRFEQSDGVRFTCSEPALEKDNLVEHAAVLLRGRTGTTRGAHIHLQKHIPWGAGLGGGSSDAAATLRSLNILWGLGLNDGELAALASELGSDVPLFVHGGTVLAEGRGDIALPVTPLPTTHLVLLIPPGTQIEAKTATLYGRLSTANFTKGQFTRAALFSLSTAKRIPEDLMFNAFEKVAFDFFAGLLEVKSVFEEAAQGRVHLAGSGPCLFARFGGVMRARDTASRLRARGYDVRVACTTSGRESAGSGPI